MKRTAFVFCTSATLILGVAPAFARSPLIVRTSLSTNFVYFADTVAAHITVLADERRIKPGSIRISATFLNWEEVAPGRTTTVLSGTTLERSWSFELACIQAVCLPSGKPRAARFTRVVVTASTVDGSPLTIRRAWPPVVVAARFGPSVPGATPAFEIDGSLSPPVYHVNPTALALALDIVAALFGIAGFSVLGRALLRKRPVKTDETTPLLAALRLVRQARTRPPDDRRRAVGLLERTLAHEQDDALAAAASHVAWSSAEPSSERIDLLLDLIDTEPEHPS
jgi:hypothetical protein